MPVLERPEWLAPALCAALAAAAALGLAAWRARRRARALLGAPPPARVGGDALLLAALLALGAALAGPQWGERWVPVAEAGVDAVLLLDVSRSMDAADAPPSRLHRARRTAAALLARLAPGDRAALAVFAGHGVLLTPLTADLGALAELLPSLDSGLMPDSGSDLDAGVAAALAAFAADERPRVLVLLSDGEDPDGGGAPDAAPLRRAAVRVVSIALGSEAGARIPDHGAWLRDASGREVVTRRDAPRLAALAAASDGLALRADGFGEVDLEAALRAVRRDAAAAPDRTARRPVPAVRRAPLAGLALALLAVEAAGLALRRPAAWAGGLLVLGVLGAAPGEPADEALGDLPPLEQVEARLQSHPDDARALLWLGLHHARAERHADASDAFAAAAALAGERALAALAYYDLGVSALARGELQAARDAFFDALALAPDDRRAIYNLEWTLAALASRPPASSAREPARPEGGGPPPAPPRAAEAAPALSAQEAARWLETLEDDPSRALRRAAWQASPGRRPGRAPW